MAETAFRIAQQESGEAGRRFELGGRLAFDQAVDLRRTLDPMRARDDLVLDLDGLESLDGGVAILLLKWQREAEAAGRALVLEGGPPQVRSILELYRGLPVRDSLHEAPCQTGMLDGLGRSTAALITDLRAMFDFVGKVSIAAAQVVVRPASLQWRGIGGLVNRAGTDALPIVLLINFLIGMIMGFQSAVQLIKFGATIYVADIVSLSMARELGPFIVSVIVAGRSGAGFAAEIGTMRVNEEIDALRTLGIDPYRYLVIPRVLALAFAVPLLTILAVVVGTLGGMVTAVMQLDMAPAAYLSEVNVTMVGWDIAGGLIKSFFFGATIGLVACMRGLRTRGGAEGVGRSTTSTVVTVLFLLVALDALITWIYFQFEIGI